MDAILEMLSPIIETIQGLVGDFDISEIIATIQETIGGLLG